MNVAVDQKWGNPRLHGHAESTEAEYRPVRRADGGWGGRIRTFNLLIQSQLRYRCATPQVCYRA